ncbi:MAG: nicotinate (nicotinamide) nucleotide adenylyltransferase [Candidatus Riflebacteria bacterium]|nr:nicotinate (nicotinamide) nucleotide adenylyltransferase [Candidatus Riflebacteria bacterium]
MRIGVLGGSFNPVHLQHIQIALAAQQQYQLDEIWFIPVFRPVHKPDETLLDYPARRELLQAAIADYVGLQVCDIEEELGGASYTVRTVAALQQRHGDCQFFLLIGGDSLAELHTWREIERLASMIEFIVVERPGYDRTSPAANVRLHWAECEPSQISASDIRAKLQKHDFGDLQLAPEVLFHILLNDHYDSLGNPYLHWLEVIAGHLRQLPDGLVDHIMSVASLSVKYGLEAGLDPRTCMLAGLTHDLFRGAGSSEIFRYAELCRTRLSEAERALPMLAHGAAAAGFLLYWLPEINPAIVSAVRWHTFPAEDAPLLGKVLVVADTLEPSRAIVERDSLRQASMSLNERFKRVLELKRKSIMGH